MYTRITRYTGEPEPRLALVATLAALLAAFVPAGAAHAGQTGVAVRYHAAELQEHALASRLYGRLRAAAGKACSIPGRRSLARITAERRCADEALDRVVRTIGSPVLSGIHSSGESNTKLAGR